MKILVVEDSDRLRRALGEGLRRSGFVVDAAADGATGLALARGGRHDVIVLDLVMPGLDGLSVLRTLRREGTEARVLILSARDMTGDRVAGLESGADDYLVKPFAFDELVARIRALGRRRAAAPAPTVVIGRVALNTARHEVSVDGAPLHLTPAEHQVLEQLMLGRGRVVSKSALFERIHDAASEATSNVVEVSVSTLRKKLRSCGVTDFVKTRRGFGYYVD